VLELGGEQLQALLGELDVLERPRAADLGQDGGTVAFGEQLADIALLVAIMAMSP
jgi:hypothetical protein